MNNKETQELINQASSAVQEFVVSKRPELTRLMANFTVTDITESAGSRVYWIESQMYELVENSCVFCCAVRNIGYAIDAARTAEKWSRSRWEARAMEAAARAVWWTQQSLTTPWPQGPYSL